MNPDAILSALLELAQSLNVTVRMMPASLEAPEHGGGSLVRLRGKEIVFLDGSASTADQVSALASALKGKPELENRFLPPEVRDVLDRA